MTADYVPLASALQHKWSALTKRQTKELNLPAVFTILGTHGPRDGITPVR